MFKEQREKTVAIVSKKKGGKKEQIKDEKSSANVSTGKGATKKLT